ncbi:MAG: HIT family protein [Firmicutes bacterium]|nr:HIT family protein [Bacillota bacterium]
MKDDCIFCKLANNIIPTNSIYEDEDFKVILDANPVNAGHSLILPKNHADDLFQMEEEKVAKAYALAKKVAEAVKKATGCEGVNILQNNGAAAGQTVNHYHVHIIPRYKGDKLVMTFPQSTVTEEETKEVKEKLSALL